VHRIDPHNRELSTPKLSSRAHRIDPHNGELSSPKLSNPKSREEKIRREDEVCSFMINVKHSNINAQHLSS